MTDVRSALRQTLESRGLNVANDTVNSRGELYVRGENDLAAAIFEFKRSVREAIDTMYQGRWTEGLPPRFAVMPASASADPELELLEQMGIRALLYDVVDGRVEFTGLDDALRE